MKKKIILHNSFFDLLAFLLSFILSFFRSIFIFFKNKSDFKRNKFFDILDFVFRDWPKYFWEKPSYYKSTSLMWDILNFIFNYK